MNQPWKIISSFIINERNSSRALCPLQTQFSNEKCCAFFFFFFSLLHLSSAHPLVLWGIHSFKCWSQGPGLRIEMLTPFTILRMKEWEGEGQFFPVGSIFRVRLTGPGSSHTPPCVLDMLAVENCNNKHNNGVHLTLLHVHRFTVQDISFFSGSSPHRDEPWFMWSPYQSSTIKLAFYCMKCN